MGIHNVKNLVYTTPHINFRTGHIDSVFKICAIQKVLPPPDRSYCETCPLFMPEEYKGIHCVFNTWSSQAII